MVKWEAFDAGTTLGTKGSEAGTIVLDAAFGDEARITIERGGHTAPFSITCGVAGWLVHTRFFSSAAEAQNACAEMQHVIGEMVAAFGSENRRGRGHQVSATSSWSGFRNSS